jgi:hypothetical protein
MASVGCARIHTTANKDIGFIAAAQFGLYNRLRWKLDHASGCFLAIQKKQRPSLMGRMASVELSRAEFSCVASLIGPQETIATSFRLPKSGRTGGQNAPSQQLSLPS